MDAQVIGLGFAASQGRWQRRQTCQSASRAAIASSGRLANASRSPRLPDEEIRRYRGWTTKIQIAHVYVSCGTLSRMEDAKPIVVQLYCRLEISVDDPDALFEVAERRLRSADIDWSSEQDTLEEAVAELRSDVEQSVASLVDPDRVLVDVPGVEVRRGRWWAEIGAPSERFQPGSRSPDDPASAEGRAVRS
ncbi:hypothetical protein AB0B85_31195 [Micromonospora sp. NPDC049044]|uniref:hypothetical protein n=1 Tax=Micromonospora sp. NPDC049044 TaxID=3154827 RepID=UPI0033D1B14D